MKNKNFVMFPQWLIDDGHWAQLSPKAKAVYLCIARHANFKTKITTVSNKILAQESGICIRKVSAARSELVKNKLIKIWQRKFNGSMGIMVIFDPTQKVQEGKVVQKGLGGEVVQKGLPNKNDQFIPPSTKSTTPLYKKYYPLVQKGRPEIETLLETLHKEETFAAQQVDQQQQQNQQHQLPKIDLNPIQPKPQNQSPLQPSFIKKKYNPPAKKSLAGISDETILELAKTLKNATDINSFFIKHGYDPNEVKSKIVELKII